MAPDYEPKDRGSAISYIQHHQEKGEIVTGLLYLDEQAGDLHTTSNTIDQPLNELTYDKLCPGADGLEEIFETYR